jgi:hypothetical protein
MIFVVLFGCTIQQHHGLLVNNQNAIHLVESNGAQYKLHFGNDSQYMKPLQGVIIHVEGTQFAKNMWVRDWEIVDGGDGSAPFLGVLSQRGVQWILDDLQTGSQLILQGDYPDWNVGDAILVVGYISGAHQVEVVNYQMLGQVPQ